MKYTKLFSVLTLAVASQLCVADTGPIIPQNTLKKAMEITYNASKAYTDSKISSITSEYAKKEEVNAVSNVLASAITTGDATTLASATSYADGVKDELNTRITNEKKDVITNTAIRVRALETRMTNRINQVEVDTRAFATAEASKYAGEAEDRMEVFTTNKVAIALTSAKSYTDTKVGEVSVVANEAKEIAVKGTNGVAVLETSVNDKFESEKIRITDEIAASNAVVLASANTHADTVAGTAESNAIKYTTDKLDATDKAQLEAGTTKFATKKNLEDAVAGALVFPLKVKKGDVTYTLDVVDDGSGDITLKITK